MTDKELLSASSEDLAKLMLLAASDGDPHWMRLVLAPSTPGRDHMIAQLALYARRPDIAERLPSPSVLRFLDDPEATEREVAEHKANTPFGQGVAVGRRIMAALEQAAREARG